MDQKKNIGCVTVILVWIIVTVGLAIFFMQVNKTGQSIGTIIFASTCIGGLAAFIAFVLQMISITSKMSKMNKDQRKKDKQEGISRYSMIVHVGGLPIPENCNVSVILSPTALTITYGMSEYVLSIDQIKDVNSQFDINETEYLKSSFIKGMAGAAVMGMTGAILGSIPKVKKKKNRRCYVSIIYENAQGERKIVLLKDQQVNTLVCYQLVQKLRPKVVEQVKQVNRVEL